MCVCVHAHACRFCGEHPFGLCGCLQPQGAVMSAGWWEVIKRCRVLFTQICPQQLIESAVRGHLSSWSVRMLTCVALDTVACLPTKITILVLLVLTALYTSFKNWNKESSFSLCPAFYIVLSIQYRFLRKLLLYLGVRGHTSSWRWKNRLEPAGRWLLPNTHFPSLKSKTFEVNVAKLL